MAELVPVPLALLLRRAFLELDREGKIFDLPQTKFFRGYPDLDLSVEFHGRRASTPLGPAAGPHGQLAQNIVLSWLGGARIIELKTVQILDELDIPRPCIDATNVGYNVEWSQELRLEQSLREYVKASMFLDVLKASQRLGGNIPTDTIFDMSVGYNLDGIRSPRVRSWIASMKNASSIIDELRPELSAEYRDLPFQNCISDSISLSTFHGCPANEIEGIVEFLVAEMGCNVCVKLNPTLLGRDEISHILHDALGYHEILLHPPAFDNDLQFDEAIDLIPRLQRTASRHARSFSLKVCNTLVVKNHKHLLSGDVMYMSGPPLHPIALRLAQKVGQAFSMPMSFSGGLDAHNIAATVAMGFVPVTTCTDLLRPGGYSRLIKYLDNLADRMRERQVTTISDFVLSHDQLSLFEQALANPRYTQAHNKAVPRKIGTSLWLYDCINCDKCIPVCPNDANFAYETEPATIAYDNFQLESDDLIRFPGGVLRIFKAHQLANYADICNDCGNCNIFCPEDGGPQHAKPCFFSTLETYQKHAIQDGFHVNGNTIHGTIDGASYVLTRQAETALLQQGDTEIEIRLADNTPIRWSKPVTLDLLPFLKLKMLLESINNPNHVHFANAATLQETATNA
ncbi:MAG TPA: 4Fe-4S dicluster domain-containing protein [Bryobacteraceae bacterium]|nr:4Fe-4S dicluster domain-containing protein [Bryobacteraceae bacterium]